MTATTQNEFKCLPQKVVVSSQQHGNMSLRKLAIAKYKYRINQPPTGEGWIANNEQKRMQFAPPRRRVKRVQFAPTASVRYRSAISKDELQSMWYQPRDYMKFDRERRETISAMKHVQGELACLDPEKYCLRGLEQHLSKRQSQERRMNTFRCTRVVLEQQFFLRYAGVSDMFSGQACKRIQAVSEMFSGQACKRAHLRAVIDHALAA